MEDTIQQELITLRKLLTMSRKKKKAIKNSLIIYDIQSKLHSQPLEKIIDIFHEYGLLLYDSSNGGMKPQIVGRKKKSLHIGDVSKELHLKRKYE